MSVEKIKPYAPEGDKTDQVEAMFDNIAPAYDFMNTAMTLGLHRLWLRRALGRIRNDLRDADVLDVATGTGDVALRIMRGYGAAHVTGLDLSEGMLAEARRKLKADTSIDPAAVDFVKGDSLCMPFADASFDVVTVAYGVRNFSGLEQGLREMRRVLRPGGRIMIIELSAPRRGPALWGYNLYTGSIIPRIGRWRSHDPEAYSYLPRSIKACPQRDDMTALLTRAGFRDAVWRSFTFGVVCVYYGEK